MTYPDSVSLVRPPNTTSPNTLAAPPRSQYATTWSLVSGKKDFFDFSPLTFLIVLLKDERGDAGLRFTPCFKVAVDAEGLLVRNALRKAEFLGALIASRARAGPI